MREKNEAEHLLFDVPFHLWGLSLRIFYLDIIVDMKLI